MLQLQSFIHSLTQRLFSQLPTDTSNLLFNTVHTSDCVERSSTTGSFPAAQWTPVSGRRWPCPAARISSRRRPARYSTGAANKVCNDILRKTQRLAGVKIDAIGGELGLGIPARHAQDPAISSHAFAKARDKKPFPKRSQSC